MACGPATHSAAASEHVAPFAGTHPRVVNVAVPADRTYSRAMESAILTRAIAAVLVTVMLLAVLGALWVHFAGPELVSGSLLGG